MVVQLGGIPSVSQYECHRIQVASRDLVREGTTPEHIVCKTMLKSERNSFLAEGLISAKALSVDKLN